VHSPAATEAHQRQQAVATKRYLPWIVATALFMEQLDTTILNTAVPAIAASLQVPALDLKSAATSYLLSLGVGIPASAWMADRFGTKRVFASAMLLFMLSSILCGASQSVAMLITARLLQGLAAAMMVPLGRMMVVRTFPKSELLRAMNFVIVPMLLGPLLGPLVGGLVVHHTSWRVIFWVNVPVGLLSLYFMHQHLPDYRAPTRPRLDLMGLLLFSAGTSLLSWSVGVFGGHAFDASSLALGALALALLLAFGLHVRHSAQPLLRLSLFRIRSFRVAVLGGSLTRLGLGAIPFLLPVLYQLGMGLPAWQAGLLLMPMAAAAMLMKLLSPRILARHGYRRVLITNTALLGATIAAFSLVDTDTPLIGVVLLSAAQGFFNSMQFAAMNSMAYADVDATHTSMASTIASTLQQLAMSFGLALGTLMAAQLLGDAPTHDASEVSAALHGSFVVLGLFTILSSLSFCTLRDQDGAALSAAARR
jgi:EmrB/QacA subfamily drug resistance transporter